MSNGQYHNGDGGADHLIADFLRTSRELIAAQRDVMLGYLGTAPAGSYLSPTPYPSPSAYPEPIYAEPQPALVSAPAASAAAGPERAAGAGSEGAAGGVGATGATVGAEAPTQELSEASVLAAVLAVIADRTGYPVDMIEPDLDLEADLSVDSIKRAEIAGELATRLQLSTGGDIEELAQARTAAGITALILAGLTEAAPADATTEEPEVPAAEPAAQLLQPARPAGDAAPAPVIVAPKRLVHKEFELAEAEVPSGELKGRTFLLIGDGDLAITLAKKLKALGAKTTAKPAAAFDGAFFLSTEEPVLPDAFPTYQAILKTNPRWLLANGPGDGLRGFFRTVSREYPDTIARVVEHTPETTLADLADGLIAELSSVDREPVVLRSAGTRRGLELKETGLGHLGSTGAGPAGDGAAEAAAIGLDRDSVVLLVGGAKGITARIAGTLAAATRCRIELLGRSPLPIEDESPAVAAATTEAELRSALIDSGLRAPAEIERAIAKIRSAREVRATILRLGELGSPVRYHSVDVLDTEAVHHAVKEIHADHGKLDGIVYAAGVIEDKLIAEKSPESFAHVYRTKVDGAKALLDATNDLPEGPRFAVLFGSIAAALGNRGQIDYASANDTLEQLGHRWSGVDGRRGLTIHWGPWAPTGTNDGMVTPELMRSYAARGIELIDPEEGALTLLRELAWGPESATSVIYSASGRWR
ncbi:phosphopantetheine binding protein [Kribbella sp. VKM Ac-2527]|uniref:Phosphopantetheine binding protein n=2 Tax=Kribbella caucasensis TaxID=2512215 RepID=A0A4R6KBG6_9ACTN|nr:phosphopantetheine binding protein [Kribbella sp. VKM Ac-2527]